MENNHKLALYVAYYLSRFNNEALTNLGYTTWNSAFDDIGKRLNVNKHSVKNWRDEFDPLFEHRAGWHQRPMIPSRIRVVQALENLTESQIKEIVNDILSGRILENKDELEQLLSVIIADDSIKSVARFILRTPTGKAAEESFMSFFNKNKKPIEGNLIDCRDLGIGYDFRIETINDKYFVEVKGLAEISGGILFTDKEWRTAKEHGEKYFLCVVSNLNKIKKISFIQNPSDKLNPKKNIYTSIQINWSVTQNQLAELND
jgi:hypothetical protein